MKFHSLRNALLPFSLALLVAALFASGGCTGEDGDDGAPGPPGPVGTDDELTQGESTPGLTIAVQSISGGTAGGGNFRAGDVIAVNYRLTKADGSDWDIAELGSGRALVSGPTFNYQRVILEQNDLVTASVEQADGSYTYRFAVPLPAAYLAPINNSPAFGTDDGELTGQALLDGTYTLALTFSWDFTVDGSDARDSANETIDFLVGAGGVIEPREAVKIENCNRCHDNLAIHGGRREDSRLCVLCHTSGAEDDSGDGVSIDFKVMIHKIHAGKHLPSVLGVTTANDGSRLYAPTGTPYVVSGHDFSTVAFPAWPHGLVPTPRDTGYSALSPTDKATEDEIRKGPSNCIVCHGDPDGDDGPLTAPAQGELYKTQPTRGTCGSCHDDVHWGLPYVANNQTMGAQANNANCKLCHAPDGNPLAVADGHLHPLLDPDADPGLDLDVTSLVEAGTNDDDGTIDPGEKIELTLRIVDDADVDVLPADIAAPSLVISGPTDNYNIILNTTVPTGALTGAQPFTLNAPMKVDLERLGVSTGALDTFTSAFTPHWSPLGAATTVLVRTGAAGGDSVLSAASRAPQNYVDVASAAGFARDDYVVVDDGTADEEYVRIQTVEGTRLWFSSPYSPSYKAGLARAHAAGATVREVTLEEKVQDTDYTLDAATGEITELVDFVAGNTAIASYTTDFVMPATYPIALNDTPGLGEESGEWTGKSIVDGTYTLGIWSSRSFTVTVGSGVDAEDTSYKSTADSKNVDFLVGSADTVEPYDLIASGSSCFNCHQELAFHGFGRRGYESCVLCHGTAGSEDRPTYVAANAPATTGATVNFRTMLHKIHMGSSLANAATYDLVGSGSGAYPDNFSAANFGAIVFPSAPGGVKNCAKCHANDVWHEPTPRGHPTEQDVPVKRWAAVCGSCHDSTDAQAHISVNTAFDGNESCGVCHAPGEALDVERVHKSY